MGFRKEIAISSVALTIGTGLVTYLRSKEMLPPVPSTELIEIIKFNLAQGAFAAIPSWAALRFGINLLSGPEKVKQPNNILPKEIKAVKDKSYANELDTFTEAARAVKHQYESEAAQQYAADMAEKLERMRKGNESSPKNRKAVKGK